MPAALVQQSGPTPEQEQHWKESRLKWEARLEESRKKNEQMNWRISPTFSKGTRPSSKDLSSEILTEHSGDTQIPLTNLSPRLRRGIGWWASQFRTTLGWEEATSLAYLIVVQEALKYKPGRRSFDRYLLHPGTGRIQYALRDARKAQSEIWANEVLSAEPLILQARSLERRVEKNTTSSPPRLTRDDIYGHRPSHKGNMTAYTLEVCADWKICNGPGHTRFPYDDTSIIGKGVSYYHRPIPEYDNLCVVCYAALTSKFEAPTPTPIHDLPYDYHTTNEVRNVGAGAGAGRSQEK